MDKKIKHVTLDIITRLYQEDLNSLIQHLKKLEDFDFLIKSEIYTSASIEREDERKEKILMRDEVYSSFLNAK